MPFTVSIQINHREVVKIDGRNCGAPSGDRETCATRIYSYVAEHAETGDQAVGEVIHVRDEGIEKLVSLILLDLAAKPRQCNKADA